MPRNHVTIEKTSKELKGCLVLSWMLFIIFWPLGCMTDGSDSLAANFFGAIFYILACIGLIFLTIYPALKWWEHG